MAWNSGNNKSLQNGDSKGLVGPGAPIAYNPSFAGKPYRDAWDIERAYREGMQKVTWVSRCIDAIAGNQARLPMILRKNNSSDGRIFRPKGDSILDILNENANAGENSFLFRYRLSSQLLMSSRGVFIEKVRGRNGQVIALHLLPPQHTSPLPDPKRFVAGYELNMPNGFVQRLKPEDVLWIRKPHPLDPYLSLTPMESAGIAIEIENLSKIYNRNFLLNDGRPGGLLVLKGEIDEDDKDELRNRFRGNMNKTGSVTVVGADEGVDFVDTSSNPRDAAYIQMRQITKEEILASFGVPESVIGNASGRTFSNAGEELRVFWMETMMPHLMLLARAFDDLDPENYVDFDVANVPILILAKQERERYLLDEFQMGLISANEYREGTGKKIVESDLADSLLSNPNLTPIGNTEKPMDEMMGQPGAPGMPGMPPGAPGMPPGAAPGMPPGAAPGMPPGAPPVGGPSPEMSGYSQEPPPLGEPQQVAPGVMADPMAKSLEDGVEIKMDTMEITDWDIKAEQSTERWTEILDRALERFFERQQRVVLEKAGGAKSRKALDRGELTVESIFDSDVWDKQLADDIRPVLNGIALEGVASTGEDEEPPVPDTEDYEKYLQAQTARVQKVNETTKEEIAAALAIALAVSGGDEDKSAVLRAALIGIFANLLARRKRVTAEHEAQTAFNAGVYFGGVETGASQKTWVTRRDSKVRSEHAFLHSKTVPLGEPFGVDGFSLRFPGDPLAPPHLTINCRCRLRFN